MIRSRPIRELCPVRAGLLAGAVAIALFPGAPIWGQDMPAVAETPAVVEPSVIAQSVTATPRVVGLPVYPGGREVASLTLNHPGIRERVAALTARLGSGIVVSQLEAGIYRVPGAVRQDQVLAFYNGELGRERENARERATKQGTRAPESAADVSALPGGMGYLSITVDPDPLQPRDTRVVVVRVEGTPEARSLLKPLTEIVCAAHLSGMNVSAVPGVLPGTARSGLGPTGAPISGMARLPAFPNSQAESSTRLNSVQVQAVIRSLSTGRQPPAIREGIAGLLREARSVTLNVSRVPRPVAGSAIVAFYRAAMATYGGREVARDTSDPGRPLLVFSLPAGAGVVMIRAYPESTPLTAYTRAPLAAPISTAISVLRIEGVMLRQ